MFILILKRRNYLNPITLLSDLMNKKQDIYLDDQKQHDLLDLTYDIATCVTFEGSFVVSCVELPYFDGAIFRSSGYLCVAGVEGE